MPEWYRDDDQQRSRGYADQGSDDGRNDRDRNRGMYGRDQDDDRSWSSDRWERGRRPDGFERAARGYSDSESMQRSRSGSPRADWRDISGGDDQSYSANRTGQQSGHSSNRETSPVTWSYTEFWVIPGPHVGQGPRGYQRGDDRIREDVCERLAQHGQIDARNIEVTVENGEVTLRGHVDSREAKRRSEDVAESVSGVHDVRNELRVQQSGDDARVAQNQQEQHRADKIADPQKRDAASRNRT